MKNKIELTKEEAIKFYKSSSDKGFKELLENTFGKDFYKQEEIYDKVTDLTSLSLELGYNPLIFKSPKDDFERYINACAVLAKVTEIYNEGIVLDWKKTSIYKYLPYKYYNGSSCSVGDSSSWGSDLFSATCLYYKSAILSKKSYDNFKEYWEDFWNTND